MNKCLKNRIYLKLRLASLGVIILLVFVSLFLFTDKAYADSVATVLKGDDTGGLGTKIKGIWQTFINLTNGFVIVVLIVVAFAQILRLNINTYGIKKMLPTLILAIIAANFSLLFCRLMVDFSSILSDVFINGVGPNTKPGVTTSDNVVGAFTTISEGLEIPPGGPNAVGGYTFGTLFWYGIGNLMVLASAVTLVILAYLFLIRAWMIYFLVSIAPLAFMSMILPQSKSLFNQWWTNFSKWVFMPIVSLFWIWLGAQWIDKVGAAGTFMSFVFAGVCLYMAITTPFKMGGAIMNQWGNLGKKAWSKTGGAAWNSTGGAGINAARSAVNTRWDRQKDKLKNRWYSTPTGQGMLARGARQTRLTELEKDVHTKRLSDAAKNEYYSAYQEHLSGTRTLQPAQLSRLYAKMRGAIGDERETFASLPPERLRPELQSRRALYSAAEITRYGLDPALQGTLKTEEHMVETMTREQHHETKAILARARQMLSNTITRVPTLNAMGHTDAAGVYHPGIIPQAQETNWRSGDIARSIYASSAVGTPSSRQTQQTQRPPASLAEYTDGLRGIAGDKADAILSRAIEAPDMNMDDLMGDMPDNVKAGVMGYLQGIGEMIEDQMDSTGGNESLDGLNSGLYRIKVLMEKTGTGDLATIEESLKNDLAKTIELNPMQRALSDLGDQKSLEHAIQTINVIKSQNHKEIPMDNFDAFSEAIKSGEMTRQRRSIVQGASLGQETVSSLSSTNAQVPLENLSLETALAHLNHNIEHLAETTQDIAHSSAAPMEEMRGAGIGAIADREAYKELLKSSQTGLREDLKGAMQAVFSHGYTGKDSLSNPVVARIFAQEISTRLSQRLSKTPLKAQVTNMPKTAPATHQNTTVAPPQITPAQPIIHTNTVVPPPPPPNRPIIK